MSNALSPRGRAWESLRRGCDVLVVGGGITGAGVALDAASRGFRVALVEQGDYASGTSSRSTRLVHGGLRYLPQWQFGLVREALHERERLRRLAPHLVRPLPFVVPLYRETKRPLGIAIPPPLRAFAALAVGVGLWGYDVLSRSDLTHGRLSAAEAATAFPNLRTDTLRAAFLYHDAVTDDVRLTHAVLATARRFGAVTLNYVLAGGIRPGTPVRVEMTDRLSGQSLVVETRHLVNAAGVWAEEVAGRAGHPPGFRIERSKGVHLVLDIASRTGCALVIPETDDGRLAFAVPWRGRLVLGTTDESYAGDPDSPTAEGLDAVYLLDHFNRYLTRPVRPSEVIGAYAGLRPLVRRGPLRSAAVSRSHEVVEHGNGVVSIIGGKLTTYRQMAEETVDALVRRDGGREPCRTRDLVLDGGDRPAETRAAIATAASDLGLGDEIGRHLYDTYGSHARAVLDLAGGKPALARPLVSGLPLLAAEVVYACRDEQLVSLADFMFFRSRLAILDRGHGTACVDAVAALMAEELAWPEAERARQLAAYDDALRREVAFMATPPTPMPHGRSASRTDCRVR